MPLKKKVFLITALLYILYTIFPLFADTFHIPVWLPSMAAVGIMVFLYPKAFANNTFYWFVIYAVILALYVAFHRPLTIGIGSVADQKKILIEFAYIFPTLSIFNILLLLKDEKLTQKLVMWSVFILLVSFVVAVPLMLQYNSIREALAEFGEGIYVPGLPGYSLMHAYTLFLPVFCYGVKAFSGRQKWFSLAGLLVLCFVVYDTFVTTSLIIMVFILIVFLLYSEKSRDLFWILFLLILIIFYVLYKMGFFISLIDWIMPTFEDTPVESKLRDFKESMLQGQLTGGTITGRQNLHAISWNSFFQNPFFGTSKVGGHSSIIDRLGGMGMVAGVPFLMIIVSFIRRMRRLYSTRLAKAYFWVGIIAGFVYLYMKGLWGCESWLMYMVLMPMGILSTERKNLSDETTIS